MADWKDNFRQGSFRGVEFFCKGHEYNGGRRKVEHEFPNKDRGNTEDLGKKLPGHNLELYVIGDDYFDKRDALQKALDDEGPGELIHPYLGSLNVQVGEYTLSETVDEGRMARFRVQFTNAGAPEFPAASVDPFQSVLNAINAVLDATTAALEKGFSVLNAPARVATAAASLATSAAGRVSQVSKIAGSSAEALADVAYSVRTIQTSALDIVKEPFQLAERFKESFSLLVDAVEDFELLANALSNITSSFAPEPVVGSETETVTRLRGNQQTFSNFIVEVSIATQARAAIEATYTSASEAVDVKVLLNADIERQLPLISDDDTFQAVKDLQAAINLALPPLNVGEKISFIPPKTLPVLAICNSLFGNIEKEMEIISENKIRHPGFVPAGFPIEVSSG